MGEVGAGLGWGLDGPGAHFDLALQELGRDLPTELFLAFLLKPRIGRLHQIAGLSIDEQVLLLDPDRKRRSLYRHIPPCMARPNIVGRLRLVPSTKSCRASADLSSFDPRQGAKQ